MRGFARFLLCMCLQSANVESFRWTLSPSYRVSSKTLHGKPVMRDASPKSASRNPTALWCADKAIDAAKLKAQLSEYLEKRGQVNANEAAEAEIGKVIGGTRGNIILDFVSASPNKSRVQEDAPDIFDYDELIKYGFSHLVTPIMKSGGRRAMYKLMDIPEPSIPNRLLKPKITPGLTIDRTGATDEARYSGLKMTQVLNDAEMGRALEEASQKVKKGIPLRKQLVEEEYIVPYSDSKNVGPKQTPLWTPEKLDEAGRIAGQAQAWARKSQLGQLKQDPFEMLVIEGELRLYNIIVVVTAAAAFGKSSPTAFTMVGIESSNGEALAELLRLPATALLVAGVGSGLVNALFLAPPKRRSSFVWAIKGLMGGPLAVRLLRDLDKLKTIGESEE